MSVGPHERSRADLSPSSLLPTFGARQKNQSKPGRHPILDLIQGAQGRQNTPESTLDEVVTKAIPIIPAKRDKAKELFERVRSRSVLTAGLIGQGLGTSGGELVNPLAIMNYVQVVNASKAKGQGSRFLRLTDESETQLAKLSDGTPYRISPNSWQNLVPSWLSVQQLATTTIGRKLAISNEEETPVQISWREILDAAQHQQAAEDQMEDRIRQHLPRKTTVTATPTGETEASPPPASDPVVAKIKKSKDLSAHEKRLLGCIVDPSKISSTTFNDVHLPFKTIDAIRTIISLPLLFPEAFRGGVLKDHATTGALLFGPPGTGKTLLARAVANASGARMLAIQPSDVNDKYFGEGEKL